MVYLVRMYFTLECHQSVSYWHRAKGNKWRPPKGLAQSEFMEYVKFRALEPVSIISPLSEFRIVHCLFVGFLICQGSIC